MEATGKMQQLRSAFALRAGFLTVLAGLVFSDEAHGQSLLTDDPEAPRRQQNASNVAAEIVTQPITDTQTDEERVHDSYKPEGIALGSFLLFPDFSVSETYNNNIFAAESDEHGDFITKVKPSFSLRSQFDRHLLNFAGEVEQLFYKDNTDEDRLNGRGAIEGRFDVGSSTEINGYATVARQHEDRGSPDDVNGEEPTPYNIYQTIGNVKTASGRWL